MIRSLLIVALSLFSINASARISHACASVVEAVDNFEAGKASKLQIYEALLCHLEAGNSPVSCSEVLKVVDLKLQIVQKQFAVGEVTKMDVEEAARAAKAARAKCGSGK